MTNFTKCLREVGIDSAPATNAREIDVEAIKLSTVLINHNFPISSSMTYRF
jgi:hypothetical protein